MTVTLFQGVLNRAAKHPLLACWFALFFVTALFLGTLHEARLIGDCLVVVIRDVKHELQISHEVLKKLKRELTTWKR